MLKIDLSVINEKLVRILIYSLYALQNWAWPSVRVKYRPNMTDLGLLTSIFEIYIKFLKF